MAAHMVPPPWPMPVPPRNVTSPQQTAFASPSTGRGGLSPMATSRSFTSNGSADRRRPQSNPPQFSGLQRNAAYPEDVSAAYETTRDECRVLGTELREAHQKQQTQQQQLATTNYWQGQAQLLQAQMYGLSASADRDEIRMHQELQQYENLAHGESVAARWKVAATEQKAQQLAQKTTAAAVHGQEWRAKRDAEWLKTRLQASEEQRAKLTGLSEHYKSLACKQLDQIQENNAQLASHRAIISTDEAKIAFLENGNGWLVQKLRVSEEQEAYLASVLPETAAENEALVSQLGRVEETLCEIEERDRRVIQNQESHNAQLQQDAIVLRGEIWDSTNQAGVAEAEMFVMQRETAALKAKYKGVEDRRTRLAILEDANKQLRVTNQTIIKEKESWSRSRKDYDKDIDDLDRLNQKLKKRLQEMKETATVQADEITTSKMMAQNMEKENAELREELLEVTMVLEQVGNTPPVQPQPVHPPVYVQAPPQVSATPRSVSPPGTGRSARSTNKDRCGGGRGASPRSLSPAGTVSNSAALPTSPRGGRVMPSMPPRGSFRGGGDERLPSFVQSVGRVLPASNASRSVSPPRPVGQRRAAVSPTFR